MTSNYNVFRPLIDVNQSSYCGMKDGKLMNLVTGEPAPAIVCNIHATLKGMCCDPTFPCPGPPVVFKKGQERMLVYEKMSTCDINVVCHDLMEYINEYANGDPGNDLTAIIAFTTPEAADEETFDRLFWQLLKRIADGQHGYFEWAEGYSSETGESNFSFSFAAVSIFIAAFHNASSRSSRRFAYPALILNPHAQFDRLKAEGVFDKWKNISRTRDIALDGSINPSLNDFGDQSEARSYTSSMLKCPCRDLFAKTDVAVSKQKVRCPYTWLTIRLSAMHKHPVIAVLRSFFY